MKVKYLILKNITIILLILSACLLTGCATTLMAVGTSADLMGGDRSAKNPFIEADLDALFIDEISAMVKLNQLVLDRMPISYDDPWPELLNDYRLDPDNQKQKDKKDEYDKCLNKLLKKDFSFYSFYNLNAYVVYITVASNNLIYGLLGSTSSAAFIEAAKELGREYEHAKLVLSYEPFGCECEYFRPNYSKLTPNQQVCKQILVNPKCDFFNKPTDEILTSYLFNKGGIDEWAELKIPASCFRVVSGEQLGTFKDVFYSLLPTDKREQIEHIDEEKAEQEAELESIKARLKDKKLPVAERAALNKKEKELDREVQEKKAIQDKLYKEAIQTIEITPENIKKAKQLLEIVNFIDHNFNNTAAAMSMLTIKIIEDARMIPKINIKQGLMAFGVLSKKGVFTKKDRQAYKKRFELLAKRIVALPVNYFEIWGYAISQKHQVAKYKEYLEAIVKIGQRNNKKGGVSS